MLASIRTALQAEPSLAYALVFGSHARGNARADSDVDIALGLQKPLTPQELGAMIGRLESAAGATVDLVLLDEAPPSLAYRVFRDGVVVVERDRAALVARKARAMLEYFDWKPFEDIFTRGALAAAKRGR